jgi:hypothetical protein
MKKILLLTLFLFTICGNNFAQKWVSTSPENKKVVLEEYTGYKCTYCPDGHKIAKQLKADNPGKVFLVNIHAGGYAVPSSSADLDLRISEGELLATSSGLGGYPAGSINRNKTPWASNRVDWATETSGILAQSSPVNVYVKSDFNFDTRELTTEVEVYYTANSTVSTNRLNIWLTQDHILGPQTGGTTYNPSNFENGLYIHDHVLRSFITTNLYGDTIKNTQSGSYFNKVYKTILPESVKNVPLLISRLNVIAFVAETNNKILSAYETAVEYDKTKVADLEIVNKTVNPTDMCSRSLTPSLEIKNVGSSEVKSFNIEFKLNGSIYNKSIVKNLKTNETTTVTYDRIPYTPYGGVSYEVSKVSNIIRADNIPLADVNPSNNTFKSSYIAFRDNAFLTKNISFDSTSQLLDMNLDLTQNSKFDIYTSVAPATSGANSTKNAGLFYLHTSWGIENKPASIIFGRVNLSNATAPELKYSYAYSDGTFGGTAPKVSVAYSENCGNSWTEIKKDTLVSTAAGSQSALYIPITGAYKTNTVNLSSLIGKNDILIKISGIPGSSGNAMFLDEIILKSTSASSATSSLDSFHKKINGIKTYSSTDADITGKLPLIKDTMYTFDVQTPVLPSAWSMTSICDNVSCYDYPATKTKDFKGIGNIDLDFLKPGFVHNKVAGYGYVNIDVWRKSNKTSTLKTYKFSLFTTESASVNLISEVDGRILYFHNDSKNLFIDPLFKNSLISINSIDGKNMLLDKISNTNINLSNFVKGVYIVNIFDSRNTQKNLKFIVE